MAQAGQGRSAIIVGAGIGGLAAAVSLALRGWRVEVFEQAARLGEVGAGLQISPNGMRVLDALGVSALLQDAFYEPEVIEMRLGTQVAGKTGRCVFSLPMKGYARLRWGATFTQVHRADLHAALVERLRQVAGSVIRTGAAITGYVAERDGVSAYIAGADRVHGDLLVGADGLHSQIRAQMLGADRARFTGNLAWRITVPADTPGTERLPKGGCIWVGPGKHCVTTRIRGGQMLNFVGIVEQDEWTEESWSAQGNRSDVLADFAGWDARLLSIIEACETPMRWALFERSELASWHNGQAVLLGDAAHPMLPSMAQGAVQALEDAWVLAALADQPGGLARYEAVRKPRASRVQARSAQNLNLFHHRGIARQVLHYGPIALAGQIAPNAIQRRQDWIYSHDATREFPID